MERRSQQPVRRGARAVLLALALLALAAYSGDAQSAGSAPASAPGLPWQSAVPFPSSLDLRTAQPGYTQLSPVRQQENFSTCWIMAATGALESATIAAEGTTPLYSPNNLANHMASRLEYEGMAPIELAVAYYARWEGPVLESSDRYPGKGRSPEFLRAVRHVRDVLFLPPRTGPDDNAALKWAVMTHGAVQVAAAFRAQAERRNWRAATSSYYSDTGGELNHHLLVVGWDDGYPRSRFLKTPPGDGAFLVKNSWGTDFGEDGYLWLSYHDAGFGRAMAVVGGLGPVDDHDAIYQFDALGRSGWIAAPGEGPGAWYANRFVAAGTGRLAAVSFYTPEAGTSYEVRVAETLEDLDGEPPAATGIAAVAGYHTVDLERPAAVVAGRSFVVAVRVEAPGTSLVVPVERPTRLIAPRARSGQSFVSAEGAKWADLTDLPGLARANVCLKAFVDDPSGAGDTRRPRVTVSAGTFRPGGRVAVRWRLSDPAFSSASAVVVLKVRDGSGKVLAKRRIPAVAVGESGRWTFVARWPRGRYVATGRAFDVSGLRQVGENADALLLRGRAVGASLASPLARRR